MTEDEKRVVALREALGGDEWNNVAREFRLRSAETLLRLLRERPELCPPDIREAVATATVTIVEK